MSNEGGHLEEEEEAAYTDTFYLSVVHPLVVYYIFMERLQCIQLGTEVPDVCEEYIGEIVMEIITTHFKDTTLLDFNNPPEVLLSIMQHMDQDHFMVSHSFTTDEGISDEGQ